jgi:hypothetical protein
MPSHWVWDFEVWWMILLARAIASRRMMLGRCRPRRLVGAVELLGDVRLAHEVRDRLDRDPARHLSGVVAAHAVREHEEADVSVERDRVLVVLAHLARVGQPDGLHAIAQRDVAAHQRSAGSMSRAQSRSACAISAPLRKRISGSFRARDR